MRLALVAAGDELVRGRVVDTNSPWLADRALAVGAEPVGVWVVPDDAPGIARALDAAADAAEVVVTGGGLGPTEDDRTLAALARWAGRSLVFRPEVWAAIEARWVARGHAGPPPPNNRRQAEVPEGAEVLPNPVGTAPGVRLEVVRPDGRTVTVFALPGVPAEYRAVAEAAVLPWLAARQRAVVASRTFAVVGLTESALDERLRGLVPPERGHLTLRAAFPRLQAIVWLRGEDPTALEAELDALETEVRRRLGPALYATADEGLETVVARTLLAQGRTLAVAESCTGGRLGDRLTDVQGVSAVFLGGVVAYSNEAKRALLDVPTDILAYYGAVSQETARAMAAGARTRFGADFGLATTGIAGPGGGTPVKPVGTVCIGLAWAEGTWARRYALGDRGRASVKEATVVLALDALRRHLLGLPWDDDDGPR